MILIAGASRGVCRRLHRFRPCPRCGHCSVGTPCRYLVSRLVIGRCANKLVPVGNELNVCGPKKKRAWPKPSPGYLLKRLQSGANHLAVGSALEQVPHLAHDRSEQLLRQARLCGVPHEDFAAIELLRDPHNGFCSAADFDVHLVRRRAGSGPNWKASRSGWRTSLFP